jgi:hypothetical protein
MATKKKLDIHVDFDKEKNEKILNDKIEQEKFINDWKQKLSEKLGVPISDIIITNLRKGSVNFDIFIQNHDNNFHDENHPGQKVGNGVYVTPDISIANGYSKSNNGIKCVFMCRVNPKEIRYSKNEPKYWVVNGTPNDIRPYRLLCKKG